MDTREFKEFINDIDENSVIEYSIKLEGTDSGTASIKWKKQFKPNKLQIYANELFDKYIDNGVKLNCPRQLGKSTWILKKAIELTDKGNKVLIVCHTHLSTTRLIEELKYKFKYFNNNIDIINNNCHHFYQNKDYIFYDEVNKIPSKNEFVIGTGLSEKFSFSFKNR